MTDINLRSITSGYNLNLLNENFTTLEDVVNEELLHNTGGNNTMQQDLDMNGNRVINITTDPGVPHNAVTVAFLESFLGVDEGIDERVSRLEQISKELLLVDLAGALTYTLTEDEANHTSLAFLNPDGLGNTVVTMPNFPNVPVRFHVHNGGPANLSVVGAIGTPLVIKPGNTPLFKYLPSGELYTAYVDGTPVNNSVTALKMEPTFLASLKEVGAGSKSNVEVVAGDEFTGAVWKLQGQALAARGIAIINTDAVTVGATTYTMTVEESAAASWFFIGGTSDCIVTPIYNKLTQGTKKIVTVFSTHDITISGNVFAAGSNGAFDVYAISDGTFGRFPLLDGVANSRVFEKNATTYSLADLINGTYNYFSNASAVTLTVQPESPTVVMTEDAAYEIERRGAGDLTIVAGSGVTILPPKGGSLILEDGDFVVLKRTGVDEYKLHGTTQ